MKARSSFYAPVLLLAVAAVFFSCKKDKPTNNTNLTPMADITGTWKTMTYDTVHYHDDGCNPPQFSHVSKYLVKWTWFIAKGSNDNEVNILVTEDHRGDDIMTGACKQCLTGDLYKFPNRATISGTRATLHFDFPGKDKLSGTLNFTSDNLKVELYDTVACGNKAGVTSVWKTGPNGVILVRSK